MTSTENPAARTLRVVFGRPDTSQHATRGGRYINAREVRIGANQLVVGTLYGDRPSPSNPIRPTAFVFVPTGPKPTVMYSRLDEARNHIGMAYRS